MKRNILPIALLFVSSFTMAQVGIGTKSPDKSALLDIQATSNNLKGVLIPRVPLKSLTDNSNINNGKTANSLLVFNTTQNTELSIGYYYWFESTWIRLLTDQDNISRDIPKNDEFAVNFEEQILYLKDTDENMVSVPLADINILSTLENKGKGKYVYTSEDKSQTSLDVVGDVINNFEDIITNDDVQNTLNQYFKTDLPVGNVTYIKEGDSYVFKYLDEKGDNQTIDISAIVKSFETITTITPEQIEGKNTGKYVYKNEELAEVTIDVIGDVINNFDEIIENKDVQNTLNQYFKTDLPVGNVTYIKEGDSYVFKYLDEKGDNQTIDISEIVKSFETITTITPEQVDGKNTGKYVYKNEELAEVTIDVIGDVINNFDEIISNEDVQNTLNQYFNNALPLGNVTYVKEGDSYVFKYLDEKGDNQTIDISAIVKSFETVTTITPEQVEGKKTGKYVYKNEELAEVTIDVIGDVINNFDEIISNEDVQNTLNQYFNNALPLGNVTYVKEGDSYVFKYLDEKGDNQTIDISAIVKSFETITTITPEQIEGKNTGKYVYKNEELAEVTIDVIGDVINNFDDIITNEDVQNTLNQYFKTDLPVGNVTYVKEGDSYVFKYLDEKGDNQTIDISAIVKSFETITTITPEQVDGKNTGKYVYKNEELTEVTIDVIGDVINNFDEIIENKDVQNTLNQYFNNALPLGNVTYVKEGDSYVFKYLDEKGDNQTIDISAIVKSFETITTITPEQIEGKNTGKYVYKNEELAEVTIDVIGDVINNFDDIITNEDVQNTLNQYFNNALPLGNVTYVKEGDSYVFKYLDEKGDNQTIDISAIVKSFETITTITPEQIEGKNTGKYVYKNEELAEVTIDVIGDVINNFDEIISNEDVQNTLNQYFNNALPLGNVTYVKEGDSYVFKYLDEKGDNQTIDISAIVKSFETVTTITPEQVEGKKTGKYVYKNEELAEVTIDVIGDVINNFDEIISNEDVQKNLYVTIEANAKDLSSDRSIVVTKGDKALLNEASIAIAESGVNTTHIHDKAVTAGKISSEGISTDDKVLTTNGIGGAEFKDMSTLVESVSKGNIEGNESISVEGGIDAIFGGEDKKVTLGLKIGGVKEIHLAATSVSTNKLQKGAVTTEKVADANITDKKLTAGEGIDNRVAIADKTGKVTYQTIDASVIDGVGSISTDDIIYVKDGINKTLGNVSLSINDTSIPASKLTAEGAEVNAVATANADGKVTYKPLSTSILTGAGDITTDGVVTVDNGKGKVLNNVTLGLANNSVTNTHLQDNAVTMNKIAEKQVTIDKLGSGEEEANSIITTDGEGGFKYATVAQLQSQAFDLTTDGVVEVLEGGENAVLTDTKIGIKNNSITKAKLNSENQGIDMLLVTDGKGGFDYVEKEAVQAGGVDLNLDSGLTFITGGGLNAVLAPMTIGVANKGIKTTHLDDASVTINKINAEEATTNTVLTAIGEGKVAYKSMNDLVFNEGKDLKTDKSITVASGNKALLKETSIAVANQGIQTSHIADASVTATKINAEKAANNTVLTAIGEGKVAYKSMDELVFTKGVKVSSDESLEVTNGDKAALQAMTLKVKKDGIKTAHIANNQVTSVKISSEDATKGFVLVADGDGGVKYEDVNSHVSIEGQELEGTGAIEVKNGEYALLSTASVDVKNGGITTEKLADNAVKTAKIATDAVTTSKIKNETVSKYKLNSGDVFKGEEIEKSYPEGYVLSATGDGKVLYKSFNELSKTQGKAITSKESSIAIGNGDKAVLQGVNLDIETNGVKEKHITDNAVTTSKIKNDAVTFAKLKAGSVYGTVVLDKGITAAKVSSEKAIEGDVLTADGNGGASFKKGTKAEVDYSKQEQIKDVKWLDTDKKVAQRVFEIELTKAENKITIDGDFASVILDARLINQTTNSATRGLIKKEVVSGKTVLTLGTPGTVTVKHPKGKYYLILEYVKK
ncbi:hypothetical protein [Myroides marinus]|uniref:hypothetical protein n=1 Tax=Myroides marinus TaxID=703342 RepID=UPI002577CAE3|nr:hypothetical protein [Myroides marinus]MDM1370717.1 hypothetical protein [Myroides marinus]